MKCSEVIKALQDCMDQNEGFDFDVVIATGDGGHYSGIDFNPVENDLYIEGYKEAGDFTPNRNN